MKGFLNVDGWVIVVVKEGNCWVGGCCLSCGVVWSMVMQEPVGVNPESSRKQGLAESSQPNLTVHSWLHTCMPEGINNKIK